MCNKPTVCLDLFTDKDGNQEEVIQSFYGGYNLILRQEQFDGAYDKTVSKIWNDFSVWVSGGSGWILDSVHNLIMNTAKYEPIRGSSYI